MANNYTCANLAVRTSFEDYVSRLDETTNWSETIINSCKKDICAAVWGTGNPDISGIGIFIGYVMSNLLGLLFALAYFFMKRVSSSQDEITELKYSMSSKASSSKSFEALKRLLPKLSTSYYDAASLLAFSIQIASIYVLTRVNFGIDSSGMGDITMDITWAASLVTLLPLAYCTFIHGMCHDDTTPHSERVKKDKIRIYHFIICWMLSVYPFLSRMLETFAPSKIGDGPDAVVPPSKWDIVQQACTEGVIPISRAEGMAARVFGIAGWIFMTILALYILVEFIIRRQLPHIAEKEQGLTWWSLLPPEREENEGFRRKTDSVIAVTLFITIPILAIGEFWAIWRFQQYQEQIAQNSGNQSANKQWTFGQVVAVTVFAPVFAEGVYAWTWH